MCQLRIFVHFVRIQVVVYKLDLIYTLGEFQRNLFDKENFQTDI